MKRSDMFMIQSSIFSAASLAASDALSRVFLFILGVVCLIAHCKAAEKNL
jgi:hypothetical protein